MLLSAFQTYIILKVYLYKNINLPSYTPPPNHQLTPDYML